MSVCKDCQPKVKDATGLYRFYIPVLVFMVINILVWGPLIGSRLSELQE